MKKLLLLLFLILCGLSPAHARELPDTAYKYQLFYGGIHVADLLAGKKGNRIDVEILTHGLVKWISQYTNTSSSIFDIQKGRYTPRQFDSTFTTRRKDREIQISYNKGLITKENVTPRDHPKKRPLVEESLKKNAYDPLTVALEGRTRVQQILATKGKGEFTLPVYDGRHLMDIEVKVHGRETYEVRQGHPQKIVHVSFRRKAIAGFTDNELERMTEEEPNIDIYLSDNDLLLPLRIEAKAPMGSAVMLAVKPCETLAECKG